MLDYLGKDTPKLGFGLMRLPKRGVVINVERFKEMVDLFLDSGFTYFDTAYVYPGSETAARKALVERHPRESYTLATKLNARVAPTERAAKKEFATSLERTGAGYFDYYLLHALNAATLEKLDRFGLWDFCAQLKREGLIRHLGFSFHDSPQVLDKLLTEHPEAEFVQLQINYLDWEDPKVQSRANYEVARKHGKPVVIMEPVKGGRLADPPREVKELFAAHDPAASPASWAIRFAASLDGVLTVLSGMSSLDQMRDNTAYMKNFRPLDEAEQAVVAQTRRILSRSDAIPCTACRYCVPGCPKQIPIPDIFAAANQRLNGGDLAAARAAYEAAAAPGHRCEDCVVCKQCERACPQGIPVADQLKRCAELLK